MVILAGVDLTQVDGISETSFLEIISEIGTNMGKWKNDKHFAAWLNVAPNTKITGGRIISSKMQKKKNHAGQTFRMAANSLKNCKSPLGDDARKMRSRLGKRASIVASAHKLSKIVFVMLNNKVPYNPDTLKLSQKKWKEDRIAYLEKQITQLKNAC